MSQCISCGSPNVEQYGPFASRVIPGKPTADLKDQIISFKCDDCGFISMQKELVTGVRIITSHFVKGSADDVRRIIVKFVSDEPNPGRTIKDFYVWLTNVFVQDFLRLTQKAQANDFKRAAILLAEDQFAINRETPKLGGMDCRNNWGGCKPVANPTTYGYPT